MFNNFDFISKRKIWFSFSGILIVLSIISIVTFGFNWGIDFTGGTILELGFGKPVTVEQVRDGLRKDGLETAVIQLSGKNVQGESGDDVIIRTKNLSPEKHRRSFLMSAAKSDRQSSSVWKRSELSSVPK